MQQALYCPYCPWHNTTRTATAAPYEELRGTVAAGSLAA
eukprot:CAMPEP_0202910468 /NCGR_PEP_ID=MMETSP1392-20130828/52157_1 /ASSEMBLY_ACC=CAM_ASM_000868 /TAXON_ID=225041 /ORGANISM="Chlamydomonas chlamydogama, Strain SAG 11-48b" /LENGTH=38 /DNA_ID= /DNA_START= /DNA_END= /DNA_ORIENTATION=